MSHEQWEALRDHGWKYFEFHARQRMQMFHFFLIFAGLAGGAVGLMISGEESGQGENTLKLFVWIPLLIGALVSIAFLALDRRNAKFVNFAEDVLRHVEDGYLFREIPELLDGEGTPRKPGIFSREHAADRAALGHFALSRNRLKHSMAIRITESVGFWMFLVPGLITLVQHAKFACWGWVIGAGIAMLLSLAWFGVLTLWRFPEEQVFEGAARAGTRGSNESGQTDA